MNDQPTDTPDKPSFQSSHVKNAPNDPAGQNFDPPIRVQYANEPSVVHAARQPESGNISLSDADKQRHVQSVQQYPSLNLSEGEFIVLDVKRHLIGLLLPVVATSVTLLALIIVLIVYPSGSSSDLPMGMPTYTQVLLPILVVMLLVALGGAVAVWVHRQNRFYLTNESVIQEIQLSLFSRREQTVSLGSIEDASFKQSGILQTMLDYGTVRLSTEGEETTYRFSYVKNPRHHVAVLNNAIESFKNGRSVDPYES